MAYKASLQDLCAVVHCKNRGIDCMIRLKIKEVAKSKGISQTRLAHLTFIENSRMRLIYRYPDSEHVNLTLQVLDRIAKALQVDISELLESVPDE
jgi:DNA-binding Xre family transcriptional regulator